MKRYILWIDFEKGFIAFEYKLDGKHSHYEYLEFGDKENRSYPVLEYNKCPREFHDPK